MTDMWHCTSCNTHLPATHADAVVRHMGGCAVSRGASDAVSRDEHVWVFEGDDHERDRVTAATEEHARELIADVFNSRYRPGEDGDEGEPYDGSEFDLVKVINEDHPNADEPDI